MVLKRWFLVTTSLEVAQAAGWAPLPAVLMMACDTATAKTTTRKDKRSTMIVPGIRSVKLPEASVVLLKWSLTTYVTRRVIMLSESAGEPESR
eukprot:2636429-Rhodomonas_salina.1